MDQAQTLTALDRLGVTRVDLDRVQRTPYPASKAILDELKSRVRSNWKRLAFDLHPDRTGNDPDKTALFTMLNQVQREFESLEIQPRMVPMRVVVVQHWGQPFTPGVVYTSTTNTTNTGYASAYYAATIRPF
jgi:hypothetical protein